jgi:hypothetical protein
MTTPAPAPPTTPPPGYRYVPVPAEGWRTPSAYTRCRRRGCQNPPIADMNRHRRTLQGTGDFWWAYCQDHSYGKWVADGRVWRWNLIPDENA